MTKTFKRLEPDCETMQIEIKRNGNDAELIEQ
jgi:hypothetical protein